MSLSGKRILRVWGALDLFQVAWYSLHSWNAGRTPFWSDLSGVLALNDQLGTGLASVGLLAWVLQCSIVISAVLFLFAHPLNRVLGIAQIPLRLFFLSPSVSLLLPLAGHAPGVVMAGLVVVSEALKGWSLSTKMEKQHE
ncbi:hypothetical protein ACA097_02040 [Pseudomonas sp. QL9]|uniref:Hypothetical membrane protein n=1 Tax=Pseudomonas knackmussii (strain DSM 6978 / CCUG 54928 / LMG 23759 / B13) TaxID=1301098 RepID=A0A024HGE5_PSEKB|nr:hypothetical protein [Pseudomonas knackmussii]CDF83528.1 hypothetical membrane protein [Pseudomonas knackmussii B13]